MQINKATVTLTLQIALLSMLLPTQILTIALTPTTQHRSPLLPAGSLQTTCQQSTTLSSFLNVAQSRSRSVIGLTVTALIFGLIAIAASVALFFYGEGTVGRGRAKVAFWVGLGFDAGMTVVAGLLAVVAGNWMDRATVCFKETLSQPLTNLKSQYVLLTQPLIAAVVIAILTLIVRLLLIANWSFCSQEQQSLPPVQVPNDTSRSQLRPQKRTEIVHYKADSNSKKSEFGEEMGPRESSYRDNGKPVAEQAIMRVYNSYSGGAAAQIQNYDKKGNNKSMLSSQARKTLRHQL